MDSDALLSGVTHWRALARFGIDQAQLSLRRGPNDESLSNMPISSHRLLLKEHGRIQTIQNLNRGPESYKRRQLHLLSVQDEGRFAAVPDGREVVVDCGQ